MPTANASDVQDVIGTDLGTSEIEPILGDAEFEAEQAIDNYDDLTDPEKTQLEKYLAALHIREWYDGERAMESDTTGDSSFTYEGPSLEALKQAVDKRDPSGTLAFNRRENWTVTTADVTD